MPDKLGTLWCNLMHDSAMWPIHDRYECRTCGRSYPVPWTEARRTATRSTSALATLGVTLAVLLAPVARAGESPLVNATAGASLAFARYTANTTEASPWSSEVVDIEAALPKLAKSGRLRAIRHHEPLGAPRYQVLELGGDPTVQKQVIVRYLSAEIRAAELPADSVAITPANYKFHYKGRVEIDGRTAYAFAIAPRKKRAGLVKGELWLDADTGTVVRQAGYLVKSPSLFVKRVDVTRETQLQSGVPEVRVTHLAVYTRLVGRAELIVVERPYAAADAVAGEQ
jgi:hypothetical protein